MSARRDLPGRVVRDILEALYDPRFARDIRQDLSEESGRAVGVFPLHRAAEIFHHRNDLVTSERIGRVSFVASVIGVAFASIQFVVRFRRDERRKARKRLLQLDIAEADGILTRAEHDAAADLLDSEGIQALRSLHGICWRALQQRPTGEAPASFHNSRRSPVLSRQSTVERDQLAVFTFAPRLK